MQFEYQNPTRLVFGAGALSRLGEMAGQYGERIFGLSSKGPDDLDCALAGIDRFEAFLTSMSCPTHFSEVGIDEQLIETYARETLRIVHDENGQLPARPPTTESDIVSVLRAAA